MFSPCPPSVGLASLLWAPGCDSLRLYSRVPTAHARAALRSVTGPEVFWDLLYVPEDFGREGEGELPIAIA